MKKLIILFSIIFIGACSHKEQQPKFSISSDDIKAGSIIKIKHVFDGFGCVGDNISPQISWQNPPQETKSFALSVYDPDAPTGSGWWHWIVLNIDADKRQLKQNFGAINDFSSNKVNQIKNDYGTYSFGGPCPPIGDKPHRYIFTIYALKTDKIEINKNASAALAGYMINANSIAKASFSAFFGR